MAIANEQVEAGIVRSAPGDLRQVVGRVAAAAQEVRHQFATGALAESLRRIADVGQGGETAGRAEPQPGAAGLQVASGEYPSASSQAASGRLGRA